MAYTRKLLGFRDLTSEELSTVAGGFASQLTADQFTSQPGVGGGGNNGGGVSLGTNSSGGLVVSGHEPIGGGFEIHGSGTFASDFHLQDLQGTITSPSGTSYTVDHNFDSNFTTGTVSFNDDEGAEWDVSVSVGDDGSIHVSITVHFI